VSATMTVPEDTKSSSKYQRRPPSFDFTNFNKVVVGAGISEAFKIIDLYLGGESVVDIIMGHPAVKVTPKRKRGMIAKNVDDGVKWFVQSLINTLVTHCASGQIRKLTYMSSDLAWSQTVKKLHKHFDDIAGMEPDKGTEPETTVTATINDLTPTTTEQKVGRFSEEMRRQRQERRGSSRSARKRGIKAAKRGS
jgi:homoserine kinase